VLRSRLLRRVARELCRVPGNGSRLLPENCLHV